MNIKVTAFTVTQKLLYIYIGIYSVITLTVKHPLYNMHIGKMISRPLKTLRMKAIELYNLKKNEP